MLRKVPERTEATHNGKSEDQRKAAAAYTRLGQSRALERSIKGELGPLLALENTPYTAVGYPITSLLGAMLIYI